MESHLIKPIIQNVDQYPNSGGCIGLILVMSIKRRSCAATEGGRQRQRRKRKQQDNCKFVEEKKKPPQHIHSMGSKAEA